MTLVKGKVWGRDFAQRIRREDFRVHSVFQSVCNLQAHLGKPLLSLVNKPEALAPNALLVEEGSFREVCRVGETVRFESRILSSGEYRVDCREVVEEVLQAPLQSQSHLEPQQQAARSRRVALKTVETWLEMHFPGFRAEHSPLRQSLREALLQEDADLLQAVLSKLIGAGPGLTPAGDDFAAGVLLAYTRGIRVARSKAGSPAVTGPKEGPLPVIKARLSPATGHNEGLSAVAGCKEGFLTVIDTRPKERFPTDMVEIVQTLLPSTNAVSQTMLAYAVQGEGARYVTVVVDGIYGNAADVVAAATKLSRIGASSGCYLLAGVLLGCEIYQIKFYR